jgi:hypothetical protein
LDGVEKSDGVRQLQVTIKRGLVFPAGVDMEEALILSRAKRINFQATWLSSSWAKNFLDRFGEEMLLAFFGVATGENEELRCHCLIFRLLTSPYRKSSRSLPSRSSV